MRSNSVIVKTPLSMPVTFTPDVGTVAMPKGITGTFSDPLAPPLQFTVAERVKGFFVDWNEDSREWNSDELSNVAGTMQISVDRSDLLKMIDKARAFVESYC